MSNIIDKIQVSGVTYDIGGSGGGKAIEAGRGISITTGETADTVSVSLPISAGTGGNSIQEGYVQGSEGAKGSQSHSEGYRCTASGYHSHAEGASTKANGGNSHTEGLRTVTNNDSEHASGQYNVSSSASTAFGDSGNTLFSVGNGTSTADTHNAFEIRQNGDIYLSSGGTDIKLQDHLGGGGGGITSGEVQTMIDESISGKQDTLISGTNIKTINNESILGSGNIDIQGGGGKAIEAGRGIAITTGATADTVSFDLPISAGTGTNSLILGYYNSGDSYWNSKATKEGAIACGIRCTASGKFSAAFGYNNTASGGNNNGNFAQGYMTTASGNRCHSEGLGTSSTADASHSEGHDTVASGNYSHSEGENVDATNQCEHSQGRYNVSNKANTTWGDSGNTLFSVGNGTSTSARHNAFEIRQNGDIYLSSGGTDIKLQDHLGGGGSSYTAGDGIDITNDVISVTGKADTSAVTSVSDSLTAHTANTTVHTTAAEKTSWNGAVTNASNAVTALGGLSLVKLSQSEYDALAPDYDSNTLYVIVN